MGLSKLASMVPFANRAPGAVPAPGVSEGSWIPNTDVYLTEGGMVVKVEIAGLQPEALTLTAEANRLRIRGRREDGCRSPGCRFVVMEISYGEFENCLEIPPGFDASLARACYHNGFLRIDIPERRDGGAGPRVVPVAPGPP